MRRKIGIAFMFVGLVLLCGTLCLYLSNGNEETHAQLATQEVLPQIIEKVPEVPDEVAVVEQLTPIEFLEPEALEMTEVVINGYAYIGYISVPLLNLELPVMSEWDYPRLKISPCRYTGTVNGEDLVVMAHNYSTHFGGISKLQIGDSVMFTDMDGIVTNYEVVGRDILAPDAVEEVTSGEVDLTLFTCTYGGKSRVTVYCNEV